mmetsp:Transcript_59052/g.53195  ORF Transcript_59052/g.53195 Transcript_59052/m.53195 type:complete len:269 (+) Transcript_59052:62-868(+)
MTFFSLSSLFFIIFTNAQLDEQCGYFVLANTNEAYIMNSCHTNIPESSLTPQSSSIYNCSTTNYLIHYHWQNSLTCSGEPHVVKTVNNCSLPQCQCGDIQYCQIWSKQRESLSNCQKNENNDTRIQEIENESIMVNQCFLEKYKNICDKNGTLIKLIYDEQSECNGDYINIEIMHKHQDEEDEYCLDYYCDQEDIDDENGINEPNITTVYEKPEGIDFSNSQTVNTNLSWLLPLIAVLAMATMIIYCWLLKPPNTEKYDEIRERQTTI